MNNFQQNYPSIEKYSFPNHSQTQLILLGRKRTRSTKIKITVGVNLSHLNNYYKQRRFPQIFTPIIISFGKLGNSFISTNDVPRPSNIPNCESIPSVNNIKKKSTAQSCAPGN